MPVPSVRAAPRLSPAAAMIEEVRSGRICILMHQDEAGLRGELVVSAEAATADAINFMARHGRGLISLALTRARVQELRLPPMSTFGGTRRKTAYTVSIEARTGVTTGISAADRARTVAVAIDPALGRDDLVTPGHVFPMAAQDGGVLARAGFTEAAVDLARLAGRNASGVICQVMDDAGELADEAALAALAARHGLLLGSIADLVAHRRLTEPMVARVGEGHWSGGSWRAVVYAGAESGEEHLALVLGDIAGPVPVYVHEATALPDLAVPGPSAALHAAIAAAEAGGRGVVILVAPPPGGLLTRLRRPSPLATDPRNPAIAAQILADLGATAA